MFGLQQLGGVAVNLNPKLSLSELGTRLNMADVEVLICSKEVFEQIEELIPQTFIRQIFVIDVDILDFKVLEVSTTPSEKELQIQSSVENAFIQFTGGTSGITKAALISHLNVLSNINQLDHHFSQYISTKELKVLVAFPFYHIFAVVFNVLYFMNNGGTCIIYKDLRDVDGILQRLELYPINFTVGVNTWYKKLMQHNRFKYLDHSKILVSIAGGEYVPVDTKNDWKNLTGKALYSGYGLTETSSLAIISPLNLIENIDDSLGIAIHDTEVGLLGDNKEWIFEDGVQGELLMRGPQLLKAYYNNEQETQDAFFEGWFKTGDIVKRVKGSYFKMVDRKKEMISVSGNKVYPNEVEEVFFQNKAVLDVGVVGRASEKTGEEVVAFVVLKENIELNELDLLEYCRNQLTRFKVPKEIIFKKELPKTPIGKTARSVLRESLNR